LYLGSRKIDFNRRDFLFGGCCSPKSISQRRFVGLVSPLLGMVAEVVGGPSRQGDPIFNVEALSQRGRFLGGWPSTDSSSLHCFRFLFLSLQPKIGTAASALDSFLLIFLRLPLLVGTLAVARLPPLSGLEPGAKGAQVRNRDDVTWLPSTFCFLQPFLIAWHVLPVRRQ